MHTHKKDKRVSSKKYNHGIRNWSIAEMLTCNPSHVAKTRKHMIETFSGPYQFPGTNTNVHSANTTFMVSRCESAFIFLSEFFNLTSKSGGAPGSLCISNPISNPQKCVNSMQDSVSTLVSARRPAQAVPTPRTMHVLCLQLLSNYNAHNMCTKNTVYRRSHCLHVDLTCRTYHLTYEIFFWLVESNKFMVLCQHFGLSPDIICKIAPLGPYTLGRPNVPIFRHAGKPSQFQLQSAS